MRLAIFLLVSLAYGFCAYVAFLLITLRCGLGPDSPAACNDAADRDAAIMLMVAGVVYLIGAAAFWRRIRQDRS